MTAKNILIITGILFSLLLGSQEDWSETVEIKIIKSTFIPTVLKIKEGDTIRWVNTEELLQTVTSGKAPTPSGRAICNGIFYIHRSQRWQNRGTESMWDAGHVPVY